MSYQLDIASLILHSLAGAGFICFANRIKCDLVWALGVLAILAAAKELIDLGDGGGFNAADLVVTMAIGAITAERVTPAESKKITAKIGADGIEFGADASDPSPAFRILPHKH